MAVHFEELGDEENEHIVFVHGAGGSSAAWFMQLRGLSEDFHVIAIDLNGHGMSPKRNEPALESYIDDIHEILSKFNRPVLGGQSMGGALTQYYTLLYQKLLKGIILVGTGARLRVAPFIFETIENDYEAYVQLAGEYMFHESTDSSIVEGSQAEIRKCSPDIAIRDFRLCDEFDVMERIHDIEIPALIIVGDDDKLTPVKYSQYLHEKIPDSSFQIIERAGHAVMIEKSSTVNKAIRKWMMTLS